MIKDIDCSGVSAMRYLQPTSRDAPYELTRVAAVRSLRVGAGELDDSLPVR
jgi:hypothetical protein